MINTTLYPGPTAADLASIPAVLKKRDQWVLWKAADRLDTTGAVVGLEKVPYCCDNPDVKASSTNPETWSSYQRCFDALETALEQWELDNPGVYRGGGIGYVFTAEDPYCGVDLDHSVDPATGDIAPWAKTILDDFNSYTQQSCSGTGLHVLIEARIPPGHNQDGELQLWDQARFFAMTGWHVPGTPPTIEARQPQLDALWCAHFGCQPGDQVYCVDAYGVIATPSPVTIDRIDAAPDGTPYAMFAGQDAGWPLTRCQPVPRNHAAPISPAMDDGLIVQKAQQAGNGAKFTRLWSGDWTGYTSQSEADLALCELLAFWTQDAIQIQRLFEDSGLYRAAKWGKRFDYRQRTIGKALAQCSAHYQPAASLQVGGSAAYVWGSSEKTFSPQEPPWPHCGAAAFSGLPGAIVNVIAPQTESDPVAILGQLLAMVGNAIGRVPYFPVEATRHYPTLFLCLVGATSRGRKGTSAAYPRRLLKEIDPEHARRVKSGLSSGEGLIWNVRDPVYGHNKKGEEICEDEGEDDKRLCVMESEFARALAKTGQDGNTLSAVLRQAWDGDELLNTLVSGRTRSPVQATGAHISVIAHITANELRRTLAEVEAANGFGNRFLWLCVRRAQLLPEGGDYPERELAPLRDRLTQALFAARQVARMTRSAEARELWRDLYTRMAEGAPGLVGALTARAEAQVLRLSMLYALCEQSAVIDVSHLQAAYALWQYCEASARYVFGESLGDPLADSLLQMLRHAGNTGLTRSDINNALGRNVKSAAIGQALALLLREGFASPVTETTPGRPIERWFASACTHDTNELNEKDELRADSESQPSQHGALNSLNSFNSSTHAEIKSAEDIQTWTG